MAVRISDHGLAAMKAALAEMAAVIPVEFVPMVSKHGTGTPRELDVPGCGLARQPAHVVTADGQVTFTNRWVANEHDPLPLHVHGIGIVHQVGGPVVFTVSFTGAPGGYRMFFPGDVIEFADSWPPVIHVG